MFIGLLGMVAIVVLTIQVYRTAKGTERHAVAWAILNAFVGCVVQVAFPFVLGLAYGLYLGLTGGSVSTAAFGIFTIIDLSGLFVSILAMILIFKHVSNFPGQEMGSKDVPSSLFGD